MNLDLARKNLTGRRVLVADDSTSARDILQRMLEGVGMEVTGVPDGGDVIALVESRPAYFDVILLDLQMEHVDGVDVFRRLRPLMAEKSCAMIPMSSTVTPDIEMRMREAGATQAILRKPYRQNKVISAVMASLECSDRAFDSDSLKQDGKSTLPDDEVFRALSSLPAKDKEQVGASANRNLPQMPGCDLVGALDRCGGDLGLLLSILSTFEEEGFTALQLARDALRSGDLPYVLKRLHKVRGEMLNLGLLGLVVDMLPLERQIQAETQSISSKNVAARSTRPTMGMKALSFYDYSISQLGLNLRTTLAKIKALPVFSWRRGLLAEEVKPGRDDESEFARLVQLLSCNDAAALWMVPEEGRIMPARYSDNEEMQFRSRFEALDFSGMLLVVHADDHKDQAPGEASEAVRILVVDDAPSTVKLLCKILEDCGSLRFALSGEEAIRIAMEWTPDLVLTDVNLGGMSGLEVCRDLKALPQTADCSVILVSADNSVVTEVSALTAGAEDFIEKPLNPARVIGRVNAKIAGRKSRALMEPKAGAGEVISGYVTCDLNGKMLEINPSLAQWVGRSPEECKGRHLTELFSQAQAPLVDASLRESMSSGRMGPLETHLVDARQVTLPVRLSGRQMPSEHGRIIWVGVEDMRERVLNEKKRLNAHQENSVMTLAGGIAHEFNNLLGIIIGSIDLVMENEERPGQRGHLERASKAALRASTISRSMSEAAQRAGNRPKQQENLDEIIDKLWPFLCNATPKSSRLIRDRSSQKLLVGLDPTELRQALLRLVQNAAEATPGGGDIAVATRVDTARSVDGTMQTMAVVEVRDTGTGMTEDTQLRAFEAFFTTKSPGHAGLGLSEVMGFVVRQEGNIQIESEPARGTVVRMKFPVALPENV